MSILETASRLVVLFLGGGIVALAAWGVARPGELMALVSSVLDRQWGIYFGAGVRLLLGVALLIAARASSFPAAFELLGWIVILAALALFVLGRKLTRKLIIWFGRLSMPMLRLWLLFGMAFGVFLLYAAA